MKLLGHVDFIGNYNNETHIYEFVVDDDKLYVVRKRAAESKGGGYINGEEIDRHEFSDYSPEAQKIFFETIEAELLKESEEYDLKICKVPKKR